VEETRRTCVTAELELYDCAADPHETRNHAGEQPAVVAQLRGILANYPEAATGGPGKNH